MVQYSTLLSALALASAAVATPLIADRQVEQPFNILGVTYDGPGCPPGSINVGKLDYTNFEFQVFYTKLTASINAGDPKKNVKCQIKVDFSTTTGKQLVVLGGDYRGRIDITKGVYAKEQNQYKFDKNPGVSNMQWEFKGPLDVDTVFTNELDLTLVSPCSNGGKFRLIINNYLTLTSEDGGYGSISVSELDASVMQSIKLKSQDCHA